MLPKRFRDRDEVARLRADCDELDAGTESPEKRRLAGRVLGRRGHGKLVFLDLVDRSGRIQLLCDESRTGEIDLGLGDIVGVTGSPAPEFVEALSYGRRPAAAASPSTASRSC